MIHVHGEKGIIGLGPEIWEFADDAEPNIELPPHPNSVIEDAIRVIHAGASPAVDGYEGRRSVALNMAIYECARTGKSVELS